MAHAALLEDFRSLMVKMTGVEPGDTEVPRLDIYLVGNISEASPWQALPPNVSGFYRADDGRISAVVVSKPGQGPDIAGAGTEQALLHEFAHHFMLSSPGIAYPAWYVEGFAEYFATARFMPDRIEYGQASGNRARLLNSADWLPLEQVLAGPPPSGHTAEVPMYYAQSLALTHYMFRAPGMRGRLLAYLKACARGEDPVTAFRAHVEDDLDAFQAKLRRYIRTEATYSRFDRSAATPATVNLRALPSSADTLLMRTVALEHGLPASIGPTALQDIRDLVASAPGDPLAQRALAIAEVELGDPVRGAELLDKLLLTAPDDADLLRWRALAMKPYAPSTGEETRDQAKALLSRASAIEPADWRTLLAYVRVHRPLSGPLPADVLGVMLRTHRMAPQVSEVVLETAVALTWAGRTREAARALAPLAYSPHNGPSAALAARMLAKARKGDRAGLLAEVAAARSRTEIAVRAARSGTAIAAAVQLR